MANEKPQETKNRVSTVIAIPGYKIINILGRGGMAIVYRAVQESVGRTVAIKVLAPNHADETFTDRFLREARIISSLTHPNIVTVFDAGVHKSHHYMSMEYISGKTLRDARDDLSRKQKVGIIKQIASALEYAGNKGYTHRDIKPENIMLHEDGRAVLMDFGIARGDDTKSGLTLTGKAIGTPYYMSPEQTKGIKVDPRSDIYSLGVVLFQALTGLVPYDGNSFVDVGMKHITQPIPILPKGLESFQVIINKSMSKDPEHRYQSAREFIVDINKISDTELDYIDSKSAVSTKNSVDHDANTKIDSELKEPIQSNFNLKKNIKPKLKIKSETQFIKKAAAPEINITKTDEFKSLRRRRRFLYLLLLISVGVIGYFNKKTLEPYWQQYALPILHEYLPTEIKDKIGLQKIELKPDVKGKVIKLVDNKQKVLVKKPPETLFNIESFKTHEQDINTNEKVNKFSKLELEVLFDNLNEQPQNANELIMYYKSELINDSKNSDAHKGIIKLRKWFRGQLQESIANNDSIHGQLLLDILKVNFPQVIHRIQFQNVATIFLQSGLVKTHLRLAEEYIAKEQYIEPETENALYELEAVFAIEPENKTAKLLQREMVDIFVGQVKNQQASKNYESAILSAQSALKINKNDAFLKSSYKNLKKLLKGQQKIDDYLISAKKQMLKGNYVTPENNNAFKLYNSVFELDISNKEASAALKEIELKLVSQATQAIKSNNISNAKLILQLLEQHYPDSKLLKKTQTTLAQAIESKDPKIIKIVFSDIVLSSMEKMENIRIQSGRVIYFGIKFKNFSRESTYLLVKLLDHSAITKLIHKTIKVDGTKGEQIFSVEIPGEGLTPGNYYIELKLGKKSLIKKSFLIYKP